MASQTVMTLCSSTPKLAAFKSPTQTLLPLPPPRTFSCSSSLAMPCLKATYGGAGVLQKSLDFKCYANADESFRTWEDIKDEISKPAVQSAGKFAVEEYGKKVAKQYKLISIREAERQVVENGANYKLYIKAEADDGTSNLFKAAVFVGIPASPKELMSFERFDF